MVSNRTALMGVAVALATTGPALAQGTGVPPSGRPTVSPYLNLARRGQSPALNYYNLVRPQTQFYSSIQQLQHLVGDNRTALSALEQSGPASGLPPTGFIPQFQSQGQYFQTYRGTGGAGPASFGRPAAPVGRPAPPRRGG